MEVGIQVREVEKWRRELLHLNTGFEIIVPSSWPAELQSNSALFEDSMCVLWGTLCNTYSFPAETSTFSCRLRHIYVVLESLIMWLTEGNVVALG